jgi:hypothetical protein
MDNAAFISWWSKGQMLYQFIGFLEIVCKSSIVGQ